MLLAASILLLLWQVPGDSVRYYPHRQVITAQMIREAGLVRPGDLMRLVDGWAYRSLDGFHTEAADFLSPLPGRWSLWIDDQKVPPGLTGTPDLNLLPISLHDVAYVDVFDAPALIGGEFAGQGLIHIHTKKPANGAGARGAYWQGNEAGDPGPLRYLGRISNVDKLGPDLSATGTLGKGQADLRVSAVSRDHHPTDPAILPRIQAYASEYPNIVMRGYSGRAGAAGEDGSQTLSVLYMDVADYVWVQPAGREIPAHQGFLSGNWTGTVAVAPRLHVRHAVDYSVSRLTERANQRGLDPDWRQEHVAARLEAEWSGRSLAGMIGSRLDRTRTWSRHLPTGEMSFRPSVHAVVRNSGAGAMAYHAAARAEVDDGRLNGNITMSASRLLGQRQAVTVSLGYEQRREEAEHPLWYWTRQGYGWLDSLEVTYMLGEHEFRPSQLNAGVAWHFQGERLAIEAGLLYRRHWGAMLERLQLGDDPAGPVFAGPVEVLSGAEGSVAGGLLRIRGPVLPKVRQRSAVSVRFAPAGDEALQEAWRRWPAIQAQTAWTYTPAPSFSFQARLAYRSLADWSGWSTGVEGEDVRVPSAWVVDVSAQKWIWEQRVRGNLIVRNLTNGLDRSYIRGETAHLSLILHVSVSLNE